MPDEIIDTTQDESGSPASGAEPSAGASSTPESGTPTPQPGDSSAAGQAQALETSEQVVDPIEAALKDLPSVDQLKAEAERGVQYARALQDLRPIAEQARTQSKQFESWKSVVDQYGEPAKLQSQLELVTNILKDQEVNGRTVPDTKGAVAWLDANSPHRADSLLVDLLTSKVAYDDRGEDTRLNHVFREVVGKTVPEVLAALRELESRPAAQVVDKAELDTIDPKFHEVWKGIAPETREWLMDERTSETARNQYLQREFDAQQRDVSDRETAERTSRERQEREVSFFNEARAEGEKAVDEGLGQILGSILESTLKDISNDTVTLTGSKENDVLVRLFLKGTLTSLTDPDKAPYVADDLKALGITLDPEIYQHEAAYEKAVIQAKIQARYGDAAMASKYELDAHNAAMWLKAKGNELSEAMITRLSTILGISNGNRNSLLDNANGGRQHIPGTPLNPAGGGNGQRPAFTTPLGAERTAEIVSKFARQ